MKQNNILSTLKYRAIFLKKNALVFVLILLSLTPLLWFIGRPGIILNGSDTNFPLNPLLWFGRRFYVWDSFPNAGQNFTSGISGLFFHLIQLIPYLLKINLQAVQIISLIFWFALIVFSAYIFAREIFKNNFWAQIIFVILYSFNIYLFNTWEVAKVANLSLISAIPLALCVLVKLYRNTLSYLKAFIYSLIIGVILSGSGINPAYFLCFFIVLAVFFLAQLIVGYNKKTFIKLFKNYLVVILPIIIVNLFWLIPTTLYVRQSISPEGSINQIGYTNWINSLSQNTSIFNVARLQGAWDWYSTDDATGMPLYIPYAINYFNKLPFIAFSLLIFAISIVSLIRKNKDQSTNQLKLAFSIMLLLGIFLGAGTHSPTGVIYSWIAQHIPFFTLFRSPWYIFTSLTILSLAGLSSFFIYELPQKILVITATLIVGIGNLIYCYPLVSGKIFRPSMPDNFYIKFPEYVFKAFEYLNRTKFLGRIIGYPGDEIERFSWGYNGIDSILGLGTDKEVIFSNLNPASSSISSVISQFYEFLKKGEIKSMNNIVSKLNIASIFEKRDQNTLAFELNQEIKNYPQKQFDKWIFYDVPVEYQTEKVNIPASFYFIDHFSGNEKALSLIDKTGVALNPNDNVIKDIPIIQNFKQRIISTVNQQDQDCRDFVNSPSNLANRMITRDLSKVNYSFTVFQKGLYTPAIERFKLEDFGINPTRNLKVTLNNNPFILKFDKSDDSYVYYQSIFLAEGNYNLSVHLLNNDLIRGGNFEDDRLIKYIEAKGTELKSEGSGNHFVKVVNMGQESNPPGVIFKINNFDSRINYLIQLKYRQTYGYMTAIGVNQFRQSGMVKSYFERLPAIPEWQESSFYFSPVVTSSDAEIKLISPVASKDFGTTVYYDDLSVFKVFSNNFYLIKNDNKPIAIPKISFNKISPVKYSGTVENADMPHLIVFSENYSPNWNFAIYDVSGRKIDIKVPHFTVNYYANGWYFDGGAEKYNFVISYSLQKYLFVGIGFLIFTLFVTFLYYLSGKSKHRQ